jgi:hypothetical protein
MRIELTTSSLPRRCSTTELPGRYLRDLCYLQSSATGAGDRVRTGDIQLGRLTLCQLSYSRKTRQWVRTTVGISRQIYSLLPLAARATLRNLYRFLLGTNCSPGSWRRDLNLQPPVYKTGALPLSYASNRNSCGYVRLSPRPRLHPTGRTRACVWHAKGACLVRAGVERVKKEGRLTDANSIRWRRWHENGLEPRSTPHGWRLRFRNEPVVV